MTRPGPTIAYFTMEIALESGVPTYAGGLGVLAGDTIRAAADLEMPVAAVSLLYRRGYFRQAFDGEGQQREEASTWSPEKALAALEPRVTVELADRKLHLRAWRYDVRGATGSVVPVYLLDADLPDNAAADRLLTAELYGGDASHRLVQEAILGLGGVAMLRAVGHAEIGTYHMNEGHAALIAAALLDGTARRAGDGRLEDVRRRCVFTTHTPVPAGHDRFPMTLVRRHLPAATCDALTAFGQTEELHTTRLALACSRFANGVALKHGEVSRAMFPGAEIRSITNGVHVATWAAAPMQKLFDRHAPGWRWDSAILRNLLAATDDEIWGVHQEAKAALVKLVNERTRAGFDRDALTLVWARRATAYKRPGLLFETPERLLSMAKYIGPIQVACAGKAHPRDEEGKALIRKIHAIANQLKGKVPVVFLDNYDMDVARTLCAGADVWVNTPRPPMEASGTSGMKAAVNGVPSLSVRDGWWIEGHLEHMTGWAVGEYVADAESPEQDRRVAHALYEKLSKVVLPCYFKARAEYIGIMRNAIAWNASFFNTHRMVEQYARHAWLPPKPS